MRTLTDISHSGEGGVFSSLKTCRSLWVYHYGFVGLSLFGSVWMAKSWASQWHLGGEIGNPCRCIHEGSVGVWEDLQGLLLRRISENRGSPLFFLFSFIARVWMWCTVVTTAAAATMIMISCVEVLFWISNLLTGPISVCVWRYCCATRLGLGREAHDTDSDKAFVKDAWAPVSFSSRGALAFGSDVFAI